MAKRFDLAGEMIERMFAEGRTEKVGDVVKTGVVVTAKCFGVDEKGHVKISRRAWHGEQKAARSSRSNGAPASAGISPMHHQPAFPRGNAGFLVEWSACLRRP